MKRISWEDFSMKLAEIAALRSEDPNTKVGCCAIRYDNSVAGIAYNGLPAGVSIDLTALTRDQKRPLMCHAETNILRYCKPGEIKFLAVTISPCPACLPQIANYGIKKIIFKEYYHSSSENIHEIAEKFGVELKQLTMI